MNWCALWQVIIHSIEIANVSISQVSAFALQGAHNFVLYSSTASGVTLVLFHHHDLWCGRSSKEIPLDPIKNRTGDLWHIAVPGLHHDILYGVPPGPNIHPCDRNGSCPSHSLNTMLGTHARYPCSG